jgi:hypothetical protein
MAHVKLGRLTHLLLLPLLVAACSRRQMQESGIPEDQQVVVRVDNQNLSLVRVYASKGSVEQWLGSVPSGTVGRFTVPGAMIQGGAPTSLMFTAEAILTGGHFYTPLVVVRPGSIVSLQIDPRLNFSTWNQQ